MLPVPDSLPSTFELAGHLVLVRKSSSLLEVGAVVEHAVVRVAAEAVEDVAAEVGEAAVEEEAVAEVEKVPMAPRGAIT